MPHYITQVFVLLIYEYVFPKTDKQNSPVEYDHNKFKFTPQLWGGSVAVAEVVLVVELAFEVVGLRGVAFVGAVVVRLVVDMGGEGVSQKKSC